MPVAVAGCLVLTGGGVAAYAAARSPGGSYRTATAAVRAVSATLPATGTVGSKSSATVSFPVAGTVAGVPVAVGDRVAAGAELATLDSASLEAAVAAARSELAQARLTLEQDETAQESGSATGTASWSGSTATPAATGGVAAAQREVQQAQQRADAALATAAAALAKATTTCAGDSPSGWARPDPSGTPTATPTAPPAPTPTSAPTSPPSSPPPGGVDPAACTAALKQVLADQTAVQRAQQVVSQRQAALSKAIAAGSGSRPSGSAPAGSGSTGSSSTGSSSAGAGSSPGGDRSSSPSSSGGAASSGSSGSGPAGSGESAGTGGVVTDEQLAADRARITAAAAAVRVAEQNLRQATVVSPIAGTVATVSLAPGDRVTAGSTTATISVVGDDAHVVTVGVPVAEIGRVRAGQRATVRPDGFGGALPAKVVAVGVAPTTTGGTTYAVTVGFTGKPAGLRDGTSAAVAITTAESASALAVPTSAVTRIGPGAFVTVLENGQPRRTAVEIGAVGPTYTEISSGLAAGAEVVLADLDRAVPASSTQTRFGAGPGGLGTGGGRLTGRPR